MLEWTAAIGRALALGGSAVVHVGLAMALGGHTAGPARARTPPPVEVAFSVVEAPAEPRDEPAPIAVAARPTPRRSHAAAHHHHDYPVPASHDDTPHDPHALHVPLPVSPAAPSPDAAPSAAAPRFVLALASAPGVATASGPVLAGGAAAGLGSGPPLAESAVDVRARLVRGGAPDYPEAARDQGVEADVSLEIVVDRAGHVASARVLGAPGYGFAEAALRGVRRYHFNPAQRGGQPVAVRMPFTMMFRIQ